MANPRKSTLNIHCQDRTIAKVEALIFWPPDMKNQFTVKYSDTGKD